MMYRALAILAVLLALCAVGGVAWTALQPPLEPLITPGAADVQVVADGWGQWRITYRAPGPPYAWYFTVTTNLRTTGWRQPDPHTPYIADYTYTRTTWLWFGDLWDQVVLSPDLGSDPNLARMTVRCWFALRWRPRL